MCVTPYLSRCLLGVLVSAFRRLCVLVGSSCLSGVAWRCVEFGGQERKRSLVGWKRRILEYSRSGAIREARKGKGRRTGKREAGKKGKKEVGGWMGGERVGCGDEKGGDEGKRVLPPGKGKGRTRKKGESELSASAGIWV